MGLAGPRHRDVAARGLGGCPVPLFSARNRAPQAINRLFGLCAQSDGIAQASRGVLTAVYRGPPVHVLCALCPRSYRTRQLQLSEAMDRLTEADHLAEQAAAVQEITRAATATAATATAPVPIPAPMGHVLVLWLGDAKAAAVDPGTPDKPRDSDPLLSTEVIEVSVPASLSPGSAKALSPEVLAQALRPHGWA